MSDAQDNSSSVVKLSSTKMSEITVLANDLWGAFLDVHLSDELFTTLNSKSIIPPLPLKFFEFCCQLFTGRIGLVVFEDLSPQLPGDTSLPRAASWLCKRKDNVILVIDIAYIKQLVPSEYHRMVIQRLLLHEIGHLVLHWPDLSSASREPAEFQAFERSTILESEAWVFTGAIQGLVLATMSAQQRSGGEQNFDTTWNYP